MDTILKRATLAAVVFLTLVAVANTSFAHHGYAVFNMSSQTTITGTVKQFVWMNPHTWLWLNVKNSQGGVDAWGFEGMSPNFLGRRGWTRETLKPGDQITVTFYPFKNPSQKGGAFLSAKRPNGEELKMYLGDDAATDK
jgi:Family of unknown function (DUF6152)